MNQITRVIILSFMLLSSCSSSYEMLKNGNQTIQISYWHNGKIKTMYPMVDGVRHGLSQSYYENGNILSIVPYYMGIPNGTVKIYNPQGILESEISYIAGKVDGPVLSYYKDGTPKESLPYYKDQLYGEGYKYYESGMVSVSTLYSNWTKHGEEIVYNQEGWPIFETPYQYGVDVGYSNIINYKHKRMSPLYSQQEQISLDEILGYKNIHNLIWPVMGGGMITYNFGMRVHPVTGVYQLHSGLDIAYAGNQPILAAEDGLVIHAGWYGGYGKAIRISHDPSSNFQTLYGHLNETLVEAGTKVKKGQIIGYMGRTGKVTGIHLHFEVRISNVTVDPMLYFRQTEHILVKNN